MSKRGPGYAPGWCIHYRARGETGNIFPETCEAGVRYDTFRKVKDFSADFKTRPCFLTDKGESKPGAQHCDKLRLPTADEIAAYKKWSADRLNKTLIAIQASADFRRATKDKSASTVIDCPACKTGKLHMTIAGCIGHVQCSTEGCVSWME